VWAEGVDGHHESSNLSPSGRGLAYEKKSAVASERDEEARGLWRWLAARFDARRLVFVDESGFHTSSTPPPHLHDAPAGESSKRREGIRQGPKRNRGKNQTLIASITFEGAMGASMTVEGATDAAAFEAYIEHFLAPSLEKGQVVVVDGLGAHRTDKVRELIEERGAELLFLPSYSPDLNPIEEAFSKIKNIVRKAGARTREALVEAIALAISAIALEDVAGWFAHCGYYPQDQYS
jgi:transposase